MVEKDGLLVKFNTLKLGEPRLPAWRPKQPLEQILRGLDNIRLHGTIRQALAAQERPYGRVCLRVEHGSQSNEHVNRGILL